MSFKLQTSGELRLIDSRGTETAFPEKGLLILAYLLASEETEVTRARIARLVWGGPDSSRGLTNLRQTVSRVVARQEELGTRFLDFAPGHVRLVPNAITADLEVLFALRSATAETVQPLLGRAITFYRLPFLEEVQGISAEYRAWIAEKQHTCSEIYSAAVRLALPQSNSPADRVLLKETALRVFRHDPDNSEMREILALGEGQDQGPDGGAVSSPPASAVPAPADAASGVGSALDMLRTLYNRKKAMAAVRPAALQAAPAPLPAALATLPRLAILPPFETEGTGLAGALLEDVTIGLCGCRSLRIVAPYTAARISRQSDRTETIVQHSIHYVLETRLTMMGGYPSLFVQLIYVASDDVVWADRFRLAPETFLANRSDLTSRLVENISAAVGRNETVRQYFEGNPAAYFHFLQGQQYLQHLTLPEIRRARKSFRAALQEKADFGPALSGLARTNHLEWLITARGEPELLHSAQRHAQEAIERCGELTSGYRELGVTRLFLGAFDESVEALMMAEKLSPQYADLLVDFGDTLIHASRPAEGLSKLEKAIELNPLTPDGYLWTAAGANYYLENYAGALDYIERMADPTPALRLAAACRAMQGEIKQARALARKLKQHYPDFEVDQWIAVLPIKEDWQREHYREGLKKAGL
ncbi:SARP family transcriptional regulator [Gellertiella hungarica]|uniref:Tetratricopeptide (TPR) repeat protein n=1 Tax=Gellertiella hungarica TaxID=1572859 RepID=A0A7W6J6S5_9HYPH|nr:SARP family transcriptional regulator [Gellertiella hungarica]MBB4065027.1 tetratricopeptide (TPR) repeat protein [Gellertiella hungarica]